MIGGDVHRITGRRFVSLKGPEEGEELQDPTECDFITTLLLGDTFNNKGRDGKDEWRTGVTERVGRWDSNETHPVKGKS